MFSPVPPRRTIKLHRFSLREKSTVPLYIRSSYLRSSFAPRRRFRPRADGRARKSRALYRRRHFGPLHPFNRAEQETAAAGDEFESLAALSAALSSGVIYYCRGERALNFHYPPRNAGKSRAALRNLRATLIRGL